MNEKLLNFMINYASPFFVGSLATNKVIFVNKIAEKTFGCTKETCDFSKLFENSKDSIKDLLSEIVYPDKPSVIYNVTTTSATGEKIFVDLHFGFFDETKNEIFLEIKSRGDSNLQFATNVINRSTKAEALLNFNEELSICVSNQHFKDLFEEQLFISQKDKKAIHHGLENSNRYITDIEITLLDGHTKWVELDLQKRDINSVGDKLLCIVTNIDEKIKKQEKLDKFNQYFDIIENLSRESLYIIDTIKNTLYQRGRVAKELGIDGVLTNFPESVYNIIHKDSLDDFKKFINKSLNGENSNIEMQIKKVDGEYNWYELQSGSIVDENGKVIEIFGKMRNIQEKEQLKETLDTANKYLTIMQDLSDDILFRVDPTNMSLHHSFKSKKLRYLGNPISNYAITLVNEKIIHPDDANRYLKGLENWQTNEQVDDEDSYRFALNGDEYEFYQIRNQPIYNEKGELIEVFGRLVNTQKEEQLKLDLDNLNDYFDIMQELSSDVVYKVDAKTMTLHHNIKSKHMLEKVGNDFPNYVDVFIEKEILHPDDVEKWEKFVENRHNGIIEDIPFRFALLSPKYEWYLVKDKRIYDKNGELKELWGTLVNVNREQELKEEYNDLNRYYDVIQRLSEHIVYKVDVATMTLHHNIKTPQGIKLGNDIPNYLDALIANKFIHPDDTEKYINLVQDRHDGIIEDDAFRFALNSEEYEWFKLKDERIYDKAGNLVEVWGTMINITREKELEQKATYDLMTNVLNKVSFETEVENILLSSSDTEKHALIFIDLDDFKGVNDTLGHSFGDFLLTAVGKRLKQVIRKNDLVGRVGGDEFVVFLRDAEECSVLQRAEILLETLRQEFVFNGKSRIVKASLGISMYPNHGKNYKDLIQKSDMALYISKRKGKNVATIFDDSIEEY